MITRFKIFEGKYRNVAKDLVAELDYDFIEKYYEDTCSMSASEIISYWPDTIWRFIDDDRYVKDYIDDEVDSHDMDSFNKYDLKSYLEENLSDTIKERILQIYKDNNGIDNEEEIEYKYYMLNELDEDKMRDIIIDENEEEDFKRERITNWYNGNDAHYIMSEFYTPADMENGEKLYDLLGNYVDDNAVVKDYIDNSDFDNKKKQMQDNISSDIKLQREIFNINKKHVLLLAQIFAEDNSSNNIGYEYEFQKTYINEYVKNYIDGDDESYDEKDKSNLRADALKFLYDNFDLDSDIENEYEDDMWMVKAEKYNL
jgi:hypothetical protein